ncbi:discoidin domain-containing protein [Mycoplasma procyoni]|uniref:discoidin domain-containing protein n=1 Tax=Mycoplasma procyoni TaxID=568784 RepID=UPI00197B72CF|nr:discoidin domain-containing protein [Mycoplasma procyoni]MBN3534913.1 hypothetical protein [Mycoplasma procyoni]
MKKRYLTIPLLLSPLAVLSCSNNTATTEQKVEIEKSDPNTNFVNKISSNTGYKQLETSFSPVKTENGLFLTISPVLKVLASTKIMPNDLPSEVTILEILDNKQNFKSASVTWEVPEEGVVAIADTEISGTATFKNQKTPVKAIIKTQLLRFEKKGEFVVKEEGLSVDEAKSTTNRSTNQPLRNLIDRTGDYGATASRWDNWGTDTKEPDTKIVFHWDKPTDLAYVETLFWSAATLNNSQGKMPKEIRWWYSNDGDNWIPVKNQDKITDIDFGAMGSHPRWGNVSAPKVVTFDTVKTQWLKMTWTPAKAPNNTNYIIGITNMSFGDIILEKEPILYSKANEITEFKVGSTTLETTKDNLDYEMMVDDLDTPLSIKTNATQTKRYLIDKDDKKTFKTYKIISYNDLGQFKVYNLVLRKKGN